MKTLKYTILSLIFLIGFQACKDTAKTISENEKEEIAYTLKGEAFESAPAQTSTEVAEVYKNLKSGDTLEVTFKSTVKAVCKNKGCWMTLYLDGGNTAMVKFKDYGFFVPKDIDRETVIVHGKAYVTEVSVDEQRHYAEDGGATQEELEKITEPKRTYSFLADGVLVEADAETDSE